MKNFKHFFKTQLAVAFVLLSVNFGFAQVVSVPSNCNVIVTNTLLGGVYGLGGKVTDGGIVGMPDPTGGGIFTFGAFGTNIIGPAVGWTLKGDLSTVNALSIPLDPLSYYNAATQTASGVSTNIITYNKKLRPSENVSTQSPNNVAKWARSKGRVTVGYSIVNGSFSCGNTMTFEVFKIFPGSVQLNPANILIQPTNLPKIIGPDCIEVGKPCTFSVDQVASDNASDAIGFDSYYWEGFPSLANIQNNSLYYSADNSSITFIPTVISPSGFTIKCSMGKLNANVIPSGPGPDPILLPTATIYNASVSKAVGATPVQPTFPAFGGSPATIPNVVLSTTSPPCVATGVSSFTVYYTGNVGVWTAPNTGWSVGAVQYNGVQYYIVVTTPNNNPGVLIHTLTNGTCPPVVFNYQVNRRFVSPTISPVLPTTNCLALGSIGNVNQFNVGSTGLENPISWTLTSSPSGATGVSLAAVPLTANSTTAVNVTATATVNTVYTLIANAIACPYSPANTSPNIYTFSIKPNIPTITAANGSACVTKGGLTAKVFNCVSSSGATYTWSFPAGWGTGPITTSTPTITLTPTSTTAVLDGTVTVVANGGVSTCNNTASFAVNYDSVAPIGVVANCISLGIAGTASVTFSNPQTGTYTATMISTVVGSTNVITSAVTHTSGTLSFTTSALTAGTYNIAITHNSGCGVTATSTTTITVAGNGTTLTPNPGVTTDNYFAIPPSGMVAPQYEWTTCTSGGVCTPVGGNSALLALSGASAPPAGNQVCVTVYPLGSTCKTRLCTAQGSHSRMANTVIKGESIDGFSIYPNPNSGTFNINIADYKQAATATLYDYTGKKIKDFTLTKGENKVENSGLAKGTYIVVVTIDEKTDVKQIIIK
jgi:Secretion system C-terminal sorting domain